ncbi:MAG: maleylacetate reductase [Chloroflexota bacterium]
MGTMETSAPAGTFQFLPVDRVRFGPGCLRALGSELDRLGLRRALVITGTSIATRTDLLWYVEQSLGPRHAASYTGARQHVPATTVEEALELAKLADIDCLVSLGGSSPIDTAKAVAHRLAREHADGTPPVHLAVPTTLSAGEFTHFYGITDETTRVKTGAGDHHLAPRVVFLDATATLSTPRELWLSTGIKALDHAVEGFLSPDHQPVTDVLALEAVRLLFRYLPITAENPSDLAARQQCQIAAWMSLFSPASVRGGLSHALGHQIGARCDVPHGITACITLPHVLRFVERETGPRQRMLLSAMTWEGERPAASAAEAVERLIERLGLPRRLRDVGVPANEIAAIAQSAFPEAQARSGTRPLERVEEVTDLLRAMW